MIIGIDFGTSNTDIVISDNGDKEFFSMPSEQINDEILEKIFHYIDLDTTNLEKIAVTGGKSSDLSNSIKNIPIIKVNEVDAIGYGALELYDLKNKPFVAVSAGTGTACIFHEDNKFNHLGGISIGGGTLLGLSNYILNTTEVSELEELSQKGNRQNLDLLIGEAVNEIGSLYPEISASNFLKGKISKDHNPSDIAASLSNMIGEIIGTIAYLNAIVCGQTEVYFMGRTSQIETIKKGIEDRLKLANINGIFEENREYGNVLGALRALQQK